MLLLLIVLFFFFLDLLARGETDNGDLVLYWDSWDQNHINSSSSSHQAKSSQIPLGSMPNQDNIPYHNNFHNISTSSLACATPPNTPSLKGNQTLPNIFFIALLKFCFPKHLKISKILKTS